MKTLRVSVADLLNQGVGAQKTVEIDSSFANDLVVPKIKGKVTLTNTKDSILAFFQVDATVELECSRCLNHFRKGYTLNFEREYRRLARDREELAVEKGLTVNLTEAIKQEIILKIPYKPLCKPDCPGIQYKKERRDNNG